MRHSFVPATTNWCSRIPLGRNSSSWYGSSYCSEPSLNVLASVDDTHVPSATGLPVSGSFMPPASRVFGLCRTRKS